MLASLNYRPHNSLIEKINPRARWIFSILMMLTFTTFWDVRFLAFFFCLSLLQYFLARLSWRETRRVWIMILLLMSTMIVLNTIITSGGTISSVMRGGHPVLSFPIRIPVIGWETTFTLTIERLWFALAQALRILGIALLFMVIPFTIDPRVYGVTFRGLGLPDRLAFTMDLAFRFVPTLSRDFMLTLDAQRARGYEIERAEGGLIAQVRRVAPLIVPVTMNAILTGEDVANAMDLRCFGLRPRTWVQTLPYKRPDLIVIAISIVLFVGSLFIRHVLGLGDFWVPQWILPS
jgi:energy-coupling factor transport system permease protein